MELSGFGVTMQLPAGWDGRVYRRSEQVVRTAPGITAAPIESRPVLHAASFPLPPRRGDFGSNAVEIMSSTDVFVVLFEYEPAAARTPLFAQRGLPGALRAEDFRPDALQRTIAGQAGVQRFFNDAGRAYCLYVVLGSYERRGQLVRVVNEILASVSIGPAG